MQNERDKIMWNPRKVYILVVLLIIVSVILHGANNSNVYTIVFVKYIPLQILIAVLMDGLNGSTENKVQEKN
jgi:hypothetical protein